MKQFGRQIKRGPNKILKQVQQGVLFQQYFNRIGIIKIAPDTYSEELTELRYATVVLVPYMMPNESFINSTVEQIEKSSNIRKNTNEEILSIVPDGQNYSVGDVVLITFLDVDAIEVLKKFKSGSLSRDKNSFGFQTTYSESSHTSDLGIIIVKIM